MAPKRTAWLLTTVVAVLCSLLEALRNFPGGINP